MSEVYRVAFIGTGGISRAHARYYAANPRTRIVAACDIDQEKLRGFQEEFGVPAGYADYRELLRQEQPDLVSVCTWHGTHSAIAVAAAEAGARGLLCEKPMGRDLREARAMVEAAETHGTKLAIHHQKRFDAASVATREAVLAGAIGEPVTMLWSTGGGLLNNGCHGLDLFHYLIGEPGWAAVFGAVERTTNRYERGIPAEDKAFAAVRFIGGHQLVLQVDMLEGEVAQTSRQVVGPSGLIQCDRQSASLLAAGSRDWQPLPLRPQPTPVEELLAWIEGGPEHRNSGRASLVAEEIIMAIYESARRRQLVKRPLASDESPLLAMVADGTLAVDEPPYDIRSEAALKYEQRR